MLNRKLISTAVSKIIALNNVGKPERSKPWALVLASQLQLADVMKADDMVIADKDQEALAPYAHLFTATTSD